MKTSKGNTKFHAPHRGENKPKQWHESNKLRLDEEIRLMQEYPQFIHRFDAENNLIWEGNVIVEKVAGKHTYVPKYTTLKVQIICRPNYPVTFPLIKDVDGVLEGKSIHVFEGNFICYAFGASTELNFEAEHRVKDLYPVLQEFLVKQSIWEDTGDWPDGQPHGVHAFIMAEFINGCFPPDSICVCKMTGRTYRECHLPKVEETIMKINQLLRQEYGKRKLNPNMRCPCGSKMKYKKCCQWKQYYGVKRLHIIQLYKELTKEGLENFFKKVDTEMEKAYFEDIRKKTSS